MATKKKVSYKELYAEHLRNVQAYADGKITATALKQSADALKRYRAEKVVQRESNPIKRTGISKTRYVKRPSQASGKTPTKRLQKRRAASPRKGMFPNPAPKKGRVYSVARSAWGPGKKGEFEVYSAGAGKHSDPAQQRLGDLLARFPTKAAALEYAQAWADARGRRVIVTGS